MGVLLSDTGWKGLWIEKSVNHLVAINGTDLAKTWDAMFTTWPLVPGSMKLQQLRRCSRVTLVIQSHGHVIMRNVKEHWCIWTPSASVELCPELQSSGHWNFPVRASMTIERVDRICITMESQGRDSSGRIVLERIPKATDRGNCCEVLWHLRRQTTTKPSAIGVACTIHSVFVDAWQLQDCLQNQLHKFYILWPIWGDPFAVSTYIESYQIVVIRGLHPLQCHQGNAVLCSKFSQTSPTHKGICMLVGTMKGKPQWSLPRTRR